jgi:hypothetical protein
MTRFRTTLDNARDELFSQIHRCGVLQATPEQQAEWLKDTLDYLADIFPDLSDREQQELRAMGERFCQPAIPHGKAYTDLSREEWEEEAAPQEMATA